MDTANIRSQCNQRRPQETHGGKQESICVSAHSPGCWCSNFNKTKQKLSENNSLRLMVAPELPALALQTVAIPSAVATFSFSQEGILYYFFSFISVHIYIS